MRLRTRNASVNKGSASDFGGPANDLFDEIYHRAGHITHEFAVTPPRIDEVHGHLHLADRMMADNLSAGQDLEHFAHVVAVSHSRFFLVVERAKDRRRFSFGKLRTSVFKQHRQ